MTRRRTVGLVGLAAGARALYWMATLHYTPISDAGSYHAIASNLADGAGFSDYFPQLSVHETGFRPPLFPVLLGALYRVFGTSVAVGRLANLIVGIAVVLLVERVATRIAGTTAGLVAAILAALYPPLVVNDVSLLTEPLSLLLLLLIVLAAADERWVVAGVETGLLVLTRHSAQALVPVIAVLLVG
ncbi:MAG: glycosyltransferase family 39 protein, partial [Acidimicrobiales bacterium]